jgi:hypothetical protein
MNFFFHLHVAEQCKEEEVGYKVFSPIIRPY